MVYGYARLKDTLKPLLKTTDRIMVAGCGNSSALSESDFYYITMTSYADLGSEMYDDGFCHIVSTDFSPVVIENMIKMNESRPGMECTPRSVNSFFRSVASHYCIVVFFLFCSQT